MKKNGIIHLSIVLVVILCLSSCSGDSGGLNQGDATDPAGSLTSQMEAIVDGAETSEFTTVGYSMALSRATVTISTIRVGGAQNAQIGEVHEHGVPAMGVTAPRHEDAPVGGDTGALLEGQWTINVLSGKTMLGVAQANPGTYNTLSFFFGHGSYSNSAQNSAEEAKEAYVEIEGVASRDAIDYPFRVDLHGDEAVACSGLSIEFVYGHYLPVHISFHVGHWLEGVDFQGLAERDGIIYINELENTDACQSIRAEVLSEVHVRAGDH
jgi:hypothetical protein